MKLKHISLITLALALLCLLILPNRVEAATSGHLTYSVYEGKATVQECSSSASGTVTIPAKLGGYPVKAIGSNSFSYCNNVTSVVIPAGVTDIYHDAFYGNSSIKSITIPSTVKTIEENAFSNCEKLTSIKIPEGVTAIEASLFSGCDSLKTVSLPSSIISIANNAFYQCTSLTSISIPDGVTYIGHRAFQECRSLKSIRIPDLVPSIGTSSFAYCSSLENVTLGHSVNQIGSSAFAYCTKLKKVNIPNGTTKIPSDAFSFCSALTTVSIPSTIESIAYYAFDGCDNLTTVYYNGTKAQWEDISFGIYNDALQASGVVRYVTPAKITAQPKSVTVANGGSASTTVSASGSGLTYTWYLNDGAGYKKSSITSKTYSTTMNSSRDGRKLFCIVKDTYGFSEKTEVVSLEIGTPLKITQQPKNAAAPEGQQVKTTLTATGDELKYEWYSKNTDASEWSISPLTGNAYYDTSSSTTNGRQVYCVVTDKRGNSVKSNVVTLYMGNPVQITKQPDSAKLGNGEAVTISVQATGDGLTYQWYYKDKGAKNFTLTNTFKGNTYTTTMTSARSGRQVYCVITDEYGISVQSATATMSMKFGITKQPASTTVIKNKTAKISVSAEGEGLTYQWYYKTKSGKSFKKLSSATSSTYSIKMTSSKNGRQMYCIVKDKYGNTIKSNTVTLKIAPKVKITKQPSTVKVNAGKMATVTVKASGDGLTYKWYYKDKGASSYKLTNSFKGNTYSVEMNAARSGRKLYCVVTDKYGQTVKTKTVTIYAKTTITKQPVSVKVADGKTAKVTVAAAGEKLTYKWYYKNPGSKSFKRASSVKGNTYSCTMSASVGGRQVYCIVKSKYGGSIRTATVTLTRGAAIPLAITQQPVSVTVAEGETAAVSVSAKGEGLSYKWYYKDKGASKFSLTNSFKGNTYSVAMNDTRDGRQIYCVVSDKYGSKVQTNTVKLSMNKTVEVDLTNGYWGYLGQYSEYEYDLFAFAFADDGVGYVGVTYWQMFVEGTMPDASVPYFEIGGYRFYMQDFGSEREFTYSRVDNTITMVTPDGEKLVAELKDAQTMVIKSQDNFVCGEAIAIGEEIYWVEPEETPPENTIQITKQPESIFGNYGDTLSVTVEAEGEDLTYVWSEADVAESEFLPSQQKTNTYTMVLTEENAGREVFCVIYDKNSNTKTSAVVTLDYIVPSGYGYFKCEKLTEDKQGLYVSVLTPRQNKKLRIEKWRPLKEGEVPVSNNSQDETAVTNTYLEVEGVLYYRPVSNLEKVAELSLDGNLLKLSIKEADTEVAAIYMERTDFYTLKIVSTTGTISDIPGYIENFAAGDIFLAP